MTKSGLEQLMVKILARIRDKHWNDALELAEELVGALKVKTCLGD